MKKRLLSFLFSMILLVLFVPAALAVPQAQADTTSAEVSTWSALCEALQVDGNSIVLADDVKFGEGAGDHASAVLTVPAGTTVTLDLAGHVVDRGLTSAVADGSVFDVSGTLIITDSSPNATHEEPITYADPNDAENTTTVTGGVITGGYALAHRISSGTNYAGGGVLVRGGARLVMTGGAICNNRAEVGEGSGNGGGGGVAVMSGGALDMSGSSCICGNVSNRDGGGVFMYSGTLAMAGDAKICANAADDAGGQYGHGGGACAHGSVVTMAGNAAIANNKADGYGGGLQLLTSSSLVMDGDATISGNTASNHGGGVMAHSTFTNFDVTITMRGSSSISGNSTETYGGGVYIGVQGNVLRLEENASIDNNHADSEGGGVYVYSKASLIISAGKISQNSAAAGGGVYLSNNPSFTMSGGAITGNTASEDGGGVYAERNVGSFKLSGTPVISGNTVGHIASNVFGDTWSAGAMSNPITVTGAFAEGASVGITAWGIPAQGAPVAFLNGFSEHNPSDDPSDFFKSDAVGYKIETGDDGVPYLVLPSYYDLWVEGVQLSEVNCADVFGDDTVAYDPAANVLTLDGYDSGTDPGFHSYGVLYSEIPDLKISVAGDSVIRGSKRDASTNAQSTVVVTKSTTLEIAEGVTLDIFGPESNAQNNCRAIQMPSYGSTLAITGAGTLNVIGTPYCAWAVFGSGSLTVDGPDVTVSVTANVNSDTYPICLYGTSATVNSGSLTLVATGHNQYALYNSSDTVTAGDGLVIYLGSGPDDVAKQSGQQRNGRTQGYLKICEPYMYDLWVAGVPVTKTNAGDLTVIDGVDVAAGGEARFDAETDTLYLKDATITNKKTGATEAFSSGIYAEMDLKIEARGTNSVTAVTEGSCWRTSGIGMYGYHQEEPYGAFGLDIVLVDGAVLTCTGGNAPDGAATNISSYGIYVNSANNAPVSVTGSGTLNAYGGTTGSRLYQSCGFAPGAYTQDGDVTVNAIGGGTAQELYGLYSKNAYIKSGTLVAEAVGAEGNHWSRGLYNNGTFNLSGGTVLATGGPTADSGDSYGFFKGQYGALAITGGTLEAKTLASGAVSHRAVYYYIGYGMGDNVAVSPVKASVNSDGTDAVDYVAADNNTYTWFKAPTVQYTVSFASGGGSGAMPAVKVDEGASYKLPACGFTAPKCKAFAGWSAGKVGDSIPVTANMTLLAQWRDAHKLVAVPKVPATTSKAGIQAYWKCSVCGRLFSDAAGKHEIAAPVAIPKLPVDPAKQMGDDGTALGKGASAVAAEKALTTYKSEADPAGTVYSDLCLGLKAIKAKKTSVKLTWSKVKGAKSYVVYGNTCGKKNAYVKLKVLAASKKSVTFKKVAGKKVKKGTYYKFTVVALSGKKGAGNVVSTSKTVHVATPGGKVGNSKKVTTKAKKGKLALKKGKGFKLKAKAVPASKKLKVKKHRKIKYESTNPKVAKVSSSGKVKAVKKGSCYVYAYAQNGTAAKVKVTVK